MYHSGHPWPSDQEDAMTDLRKHLVLKIKYFLRLCNHVDFSIICYLDIHRSHNVVLQIWYTMEWLETAHLAYMFWALARGSSFVNKYLNSIISTRLLPHTRGAILPSQLLKLDAMELQSIFICMGWLHIAKQKVWKAFLTVLSGESLKFKILRSLRWALLTQE